MFDPLLQKQIKKVFFKLQGLVDEEEVLIEQLEKQRLQQLLDNQKRNDEINMKQLENRKQDNNNLTQIHIPESCQYFHSPLNILSLCHVVHQTQQYKAQPFMFFYLNTTMHNFKQYCKLIGKYQFLFKNIYIAMITTEQEFIVKDATQQVDEMRLINVICDSSFQLIDKLLSYHRVFLYPFTMVFDRFENVIFTANQANSFYILENQKNEEVERFQYVSQLINQFNTQMMNPLCTFTQKCSPIEHLLSKLVTYRKVSEYKLGQPIYIEILQKLDIVNKLYHQYQIIERDEIEFKQMHINKSMQNNLNHIMSQLSNDSEQLLNSLQNKQMKIDNNNSLISYVQRQCGNIFTHLHSLQKKFKDVYFVLVVQNDQVEMERLYRICSTVNGLNIAFDKNKVFEQVNKQNKKIWRINVKSHRSYAIIYDRNGCMNWQGVSTENCVNQQLSQLNDNDIKIM